MEKLSALAAVAALCVCAPAQAQTRVWLSGYVDMSIKHLRSSGPGSTTRMSSGGLNNSRFNLSGVEELGDGNKAIFTIEPTFSANNGQQAAQFRQSFVGLKGAWGELTLGRQFTPSYWIAGYADPTWAAEFSMVNNMQFFYAPYRTDGAVQYKTPAFHGLSGRFMMSNGEGDSSKAGRFISTALEYREGPLFLGLASEQQHTKDIFGPTRVHSSRDNYLSAVYRIGAVEPTFIFHSYNGYYAYPPYIAFNARGWDVQLGARWKIDGRNRLYASVVRRHDDENKRLSSATGFVVGFIHGLSKRTDLYASVARVQHDRAAPVPYPVTFQNYPNAGQNPTGYQIGIRHAF